MNTQPGSTLSGPDPLLPVLIVGISGATWDVIDPLMASGLLPSFRGLVERGTRGRLASVRAGHDRHYRPQVAWPALFSGRVPERNGMTEYFHTYSDLKSPCIWHHFEAKGLPVGLFAAPVTWPPPKVNGFVVPAPYGRDEQAWPAELSYIMAYYRHHQNSKLETSYFSTARKSLRFIPMLAGSAWDPRLMLRLLGSATSFALAGDAEVKRLALRGAKQALSTLLFSSLNRRFGPQLSIFTNFEVDYVSHRYWRYHAAELFPPPTSPILPRLRRAVTDAYEGMDVCLGHLLRRLPRGCIVAVVSEHGMRAEPESGELGAWQYLINSRRLSELVGTSPEHLAVPIARWVAFRRRDGTALSADLRAGVEEIRVVESGLPLFTVRSHDDSELIVKLNIHRSDYPTLSDVGSLQLEAPHVGIRPVRTVLDRVGPIRSAMHARDGVLLIAGEGIRPGFEITGATVLDVMPTLLYAAGLEPPQDLDGKVLDLFN